MGDDGDIPNFTYFAELILLQKTQKTMLYNVSFIVLQKSCVILYIKIRLEAS